jgi:KTSC domain
MAEVEIPTRTSSQVDAAYYDADEQKMRVVFVNGSEYLYDKVDQAKADAMADTPWIVMKTELPFYVKIA